MAITYSFYILTGLSSEQLMRTMLLALGVPRDPDDGRGVDAPNFSAAAGPVEGRSREISLERFGFTPDQNLNFRTWGSEYWRGDYSLFPPPYELKAFAVT